MHYCIIDNTYSTQHCKKNTPRKLPKLSLCISTWQMRVSVSNKSIRTQWLKTNSGARLQVEIPALPLTSWVTENL